MVVLSLNRLLCSVFLISTAVLSYEIILIRLITISQWQHSAYLIISLALLGYGVSGTFLSLFKHHNPILSLGFYRINCFFFSLSLLFCFHLSQQLPFNATQLFWQWQQSLYLSATYLLLSLPFFFAANCIALGFLFYPEKIPTVYAADLLGAGLGAISVILLLNLVFPTDGLIWTGVIAVLGFIVTIKHNGVVISMLVACVLLLVLIPVRWLPLNYAEYKDLPNRLRIIGAETIREESSVYGVVTTVRSPTVPFRQAPGMSIQIPSEPPEQLGIYVDGHGSGVINRYAADPAQQKWLDLTTNALAYHLTQYKQVLVLGAGGGTGVLQAHYHHAPYIDAVELNPIIIDLVEHQFADFAGHLYQQPGVTVYQQEARGFLSNSKKTYDILQISLTGGFSASATGMGALNENYLYTLEGLTAAFQRLTPTGFLSITRWLALPPKESLKLVATSVTMLKKKNIDNPEHHILLIRGWRTSTLLISPSPITAAQITKLKAFCQERGFDVAWYPGMQATDANQFNQLHQPWFYQAVTQLTGENAEQFIKDYKFNIRPSTDDQPYFGHFFRWRVLPELVEARGRGGYSQMAWGYPVLILAFVQALLLACILIVLPLHRLKQSIRRKRVFVYFSMLGFAFLFVEIVFIEKLMLFLHQPIYAVAVVLSGFLVFSGLGSLSLNRLCRRFSSRQLMLIIVVTITFISLIYQYFLPQLLQPFSGATDGWRMLLAWFVIAPLAFVMGMPFPMALQQVGVQQGGMLPWAWGINGCASVVSSILATIEAVHWGFTWVLFSAIVFYWIAYFSFPHRIIKSAT